MQDHQPMHEADDKRAVRLKRRIESLQSRLASLPVEGDEWSAVRRKVDDLLLECAQLAGPKQDDWRMYFEATGVDDDDDDAQEGDVPASKKREGRGRKKGDGARESEKGKEKETRGRERRTDFHIAPSRGDKEAQLRRHVSIMRSHLSSLRPGGGEWLQVQRELDALTAEQLQMEEAASAGETGDPSRDDTLHHQARSKSHILDMQGRIQEMQQRFSLLKPETLEWRDVQCELDALLSQRLMLEDAEGDRSATAAPGSLVIVHPRSVQNRRIEERAADGGGRRREVRPPPLPARVTQADIERFVSWHERARLSPPASPGRLEPQSPRLGTWRVPTEGCNETERMRKEICVRALMMAMGCDLGKALKVWDDPAKAWDLPSMCPDASLWHLAPYAASLGFIATDGPETAFAFAKTDWDDDEEEVAEKEEAMPGGEREARDRDEMVVHACCECPRCGDLAGKVCVTRLGIGGDAKAIAMCRNAGCPGGATVAHVFGADGWVAIDGRYADLVKMLRYELARTV
jgi:hypothetical protein